MDNIVDTTSESENQTADENGLESKRRRKETAREENHHKMRGRYERE